MKKPRRNKFEQLEDLFYDLEIDQQERMLNTLNSLFRMKCRLAETARVESARESLDRAQQPKTDAVASAARDRDRCPRCSHPIGHHGGTGCLVAAKTSSACDCSLTRAQADESARCAVNQQGSLLDEPATESVDGGSQVIDASTLTQEPGTNKIRIPKP